MDLDLKHNEFLSHVFRYKRMRQFQRPLSPHLSRHEEWVLLFMLRRLRTGR